MPLNIDSRTSIASLLDPAARTASANGAAVDVSGYDREAVAILHSAGGSGTNPTLDVKLQESDDGSTGWTDISGASFSQVTTSASLQKIRIGIGGTKKYIRAVATIGGSSPSFDFAVSLLALDRVST